jgi:LPXTG-site transpeptidase (sortase) family protein
MRISRHTTLRKANLFLISFFAFSLLVYFFMNGGAYWRILRYDLFLNTFASSDLKNGELLEVKDGVSAPNDPAHSVFAGGYTLIIPKIDTMTPIVIPRNPSKEGILAALEEGVGLYPGSVDVGVAGRTIILGHSSRASWYFGQYAYIFSLLHKLDASDSFYVTGGGKRYTYKVIANKVLSPVDTNSLLATTSPDSEIDLVTCYPVGSASQRTIIQAKLVKVEKI